MRAWGRAAGYRLRCGWLTRLAPSTLNQETGGGLRHTDVAWAPRSLEPNRVAEPNERNCVTADRFDRFLPLAGVLIGL